MPPVRIHCWGGFGSQLYAALICQRLSRKLGRRSVLVFHTGGVTRRELEIEALLSGTSFHIIDDYSGSPIIKLKLAKVSKIRSALKLALTSLGIFSECNSESDWEYIRWWVFQVRGHYSYIGVNDDEIHHLFCDFQTHNVKTPAVNISLHYRLGDLVGLEQKSFIDPNRIRTALGLAKSLSPGSQTMRISSDSRHLAEDLIQESSRLDFEFPIQDNPISIIHFLADSEVFIATNSKISIWTIMLRIHISPGCINFVPYEIKEALEHNVTSNDSSGIIYY